MTDNDPTSAGPTTPGGFAGPSAEEAVLARIGAAGLLPVLRLRDAEETAATVGRLVAAGLDVVELTTSIPGWEDAVRRVRAEHPGLTVGVGTVTTPDQAERAVAAGAAFCVSPRLVPTVRAALDGSGVPLVEGGLTPTEVLSAAEHGVAKLFPAHVGGVRYLSSLLAVAPEARIVPTGGIPLGEVGAWRAAGAFAVGVGGGLAGEPDLRSRIRQALGR